MALAAMVTYLEINGCGESRRLGIHLAVGSHAATRELSPSLQVRLRVLLISFPASSFLLAHSTASRSLAPAAGDHRGAPWSEISGFCYLDRFQVWQASLDVALLKRLEHRWGVGELDLPPSFDLPAHRLEAPLHAINANQDVYESRTTSSALPSFCWSTLRSC